MAEDWQSGGFGLYIHWPFCEAKCPYCDFNSHVAAKIDQDRWRNAYLREVDRVAALVPGRPLKSVFFGGGTPSLMDPGTVSAVLDRIRAYWSVSNDFEVTLEANPGSVDAGRFRAYAAGGVSRVSIGIQALNDDDLRRLGRIHTAEEARLAFDIARNAFDRVSFDLIYARQGQAISAWREELGEALEMAADHLSLYQLTIEPDTAFGNRFAAGGLRDLPTDDTAADMYHVTQEVCEAVGLNAYEVSNHARPGAESRHNLIYWRYGDYAGIGPGAHGRLTLNGQRHATEAWSNPEKWLSAVAEARPDKYKAPLAGSDQAVEYLMMGLRLRDGIDENRFAGLAGGPLDPIKLRELEDLGMITRTNGNLRTTRQGRILLNSVIGSLLPD